MEGGKELETSLFTMALGLEEPWYVDDVAFDAAMKQIDFEVAFKAGSRFGCPSCGVADQPVHNTWRRSSEHRRFFENKALAPTLFADTAPRRQTIGVPQYTEGTIIAGSRACR